MRRPLLRLEVHLVSLVTAVAAAGQALPDLSPSAQAAGALQSLSLDPARRAALQAAVQKRDYAFAEQLLAEEARRDPSSPAILLVLGNVLFLDGQYLNAAVALKKADRLSRLDERHRLLLALSYIAMGRLNWAGPELDKLAQANPSNAVYPYWLSRVAYSKNHIRAALAQAQKAVQLDPNYMKAYDQLGLCYENADEPEQAITAYREAIRLNRKLPAQSPWPLANLGTLLFRLERFDEAEASLREAIAIDPRFPVARFRLGRVLERKERLDEAIAELEQAARLNPSYPEPHYALSRIHRRREQADAARRELRTFQELKSMEKREGAAALR
jgi:tetratricopeptide (TPR) repeat protein